MLNWIRNNAFFLALVTVLVAAVLLALRVGDSLDQNPASEPLEIRVEDPLAAMSALDPLTGEELMLDYSTPRTILFILRGQDLSREETLSFWNRIGDSREAGTEVYGLLSLPADYPPVDIETHFKLLRISQKEQLLVNGIVGTPMTIALKKGGELEGFWIGHPNIEKQRRIIEELEQWEFVRSVND